MKLYLKQKAFSWRNKFFVYDENGNDKYYVEGELFSLEKKLHIYDLQGNELRLIYQKVMSFLPKYYISKNGEDAALVVKNFTFFSQSYSVENFGWEVKGNFTAHEYEISSGSGAVATVSKHWFTFGDSYEIDIADGVNEVDALAVVLIIDACFQASSNAVSSAST